MVYEPRREKTGLLPMRNQPRTNCEADQRLCFRYMDSTISLLFKSEISSVYPGSVTVQDGLCQTWSETRTPVFSRRGSNYCHGHGNMMIFSVENTKHFVFDDLKMMNITKKIQSHGK